MKKVSIIIALVLVLTSFCISVSGETILAKYTAAFSETQGENGWYFMKFGSELSELEWNDAGYWGTSPYLCGWEVNTGADGSGVGYKFVTPASGTILLRGDVAQTNPDCAKGDGVTASIYQGVTELWTSGVIKYGIDNASYELTLTVTKGEDLYFRVDPRANNYWDFTVWFPTVEYTDITYEDLCSYHQKKNGVMTRLNFDEELNGYQAEDGKAFISESQVMPSGEYSLVKRLVIPSEGSFRILAELDIRDVFVGSTIATVYQNGVPVWKQLFVDDDTGTLDVRIFSQPGDVIEVELSVADYSAGDYIKWTCSMERFIGTLPCTASTTAGYSREIKKEISLKSLFKTSQGKDGVEFYTIKNDMKYPMKFNSEYYRWEQNVPSRAFVQPILTYSDEEGYISEKKICPGYLNESVIEYTVAQSGLLWIYGDIKTDVSSDGVVAKILLNGEKLWSNRVGGERSVRWDEPYGISYFLNSVDVITYVDKGDKLTFGFDQWRKAGNDAVNTDNIKLRYVRGDVLSDTTRWKLKESVVVDTLKKCFYKDGSCERLDMYIDSGTTYVSGHDLQKLIGIDAEDGKYYSLRDIAEENKINIEWAADRLVLLHDGIPLRFGYSEISEIDTYLKVCEKPLVSVGVVDESGTDKSEFVFGKKYFVKMTCDNLTTESQKIQVIVSMYKDGRLSEIVLPDMIDVGVDESVSIDESVGNKIQFTPGTDVDTVKVFVWNGMNITAPLCSSVQLSHVE